jgi:hypothetical protein
VVNHDVIREYVGKFGPDYLPALEAAIEDHERREEGSR